MAKPRFLFLFTGTLALFVYVATLAPTITWRNDGVDSGDLATAVAVGGVPHPPGYPTYLILGEVFKLLPFGDVAYRLNLLSASCAALAVALVALVIHHTLMTAESTAAPALDQAWVSEDTNRAHSRTWLCAASASLMLAFSSTFWSQAVITEVYALNALLVATLLYGALRVQPANERWLVPVLAGLLGLSLGNHPSSLLLLPMLIWKIGARWRWQLVVAASLAFCVGLCVYAIIPIRAATSAPINWGVATTFPSFWWLVSAQPYQQLFLALPWKFVPVRIAAELRLLGEAFVGWGFLLGLIGLRSLRLHNRPLAYGSLISLLLISGYAIGYDTTDSYLYLMPALLVFAVWVGWGFNHLGRSVQRFVPSRRSSRYAIVAGVMLPPLLSLALNLPHQNISQDNEALAYAQQSLNLVAPDAVIVTQTDTETFALWYARYGLDMRSDTAVVSSNLLPYAWYRDTLRRTHPHLHLNDQAGQPLTSLSSLIEMNAFDSPLYLGTAQPSEVEGFHLEPVGQLWRVVKSEVAPIGAAPTAQMPALTSPSTAMPLSFESP
jgi:hypothetical protein